MKKICSVVLLAVLLVFIGSGNVGAAADEIKVYVDGGQVAFPDQKPIINADSRTLVPVRFVSEALGADVEWQGDTDTVSIVHKGKSIRLVIGQKQARVDEDSIALDTAAVLVNSRTMVPLRFVSECLGAEVQWDQYARAVYITTFEKEVTPFAGTALNKGVLVEDTGYDLYEPGAQYMYVTYDQLPAKFGNDIIFSIEPGQETITVKQSTSNMSSDQMLIIQGGLIIGARSGAHGKVVNPFTAQYDTQNACDVALGSPRVNLNKVEAFAFRGGKDLTTLFLIVENPLYKGEWRP